MDRILGALLMLLASGTAVAACYGGPYVFTCTDAYGNSYQVYRNQNTTQVYGNNPRTGSNWSQSSRVDNEDRRRRFPWPRCHPERQFTQRTGPRFRDRASGCTFRHGTDRLQSRRARG